MAFSWQIQDRLIERHKKTLQEPQVLNLLSECFQTPCIANEIQTLERLRIWFEFGGLPRDILSGLSVQSMVISAVDINFLQQIQFYGSDVFHYIAQYCFISSIKCSNTPVDPPFPGYSILHHPPSLAPWHCGNP